MGPAADAEAGLAVAQPGLPPPRPPPGQGTEQQGDLGGPSQDQDRPRTRPGSDRQCRRRAARARLLIPAGFGFQGGPQSQGPNSIEQILA